MAMYQDLRPGDSIQIGAAVITVEAKSGTRARLKIDSPDDVRVIRAEDAGAEIAKPAAPSAPKQMASAAKPPQLAVPALNFG
jgi:sRNA-binding carbon storage regulator CsrA